MISWCDVITQGLWPQSQSLTAVGKFDGQLKRAVVAVQHQLRLLPFCSTRPAVLPATSAPQSAGMLYDDATEAGDARFNGDSGQGGVVPLLDALCNLALVRHLICYSAPIPPELHTPLQG